MSNKVCVPNKTKDLKLSMLNRNTVINESLTLKKHISCECKYRFDEKNQINGGIYNCECWCECENIIYVKKIMFGILLYVIVKMKNI